MKSTEVSTLYTLWLGFRSSLYWLMFLPSTLLFSLLVLVFFWTPIRFRVALIKAWIRLNLWWIKRTCGLGYEVEGLENIPRNEGFIVMSKHSSTWETIALQLFFPPMVWVVKRELMWIPFFGWGLKAMDAIGINRGTGRKAVRQLVEEGRQRMEQGRIVMLFPEGTRVYPGQYKPFKIGGAILAAKTGYKIVPVAHNAGEFWPRHSWIKWPGTIKVVIGPPIDPAGKKPDQIIKEVEQWIVTTTERISDPQQLRRLGVS